MMAARMPLTPLKEDEGLSQDELDADVGALDEALASGSICADDLQLNYADLEFSEQIGSGSYGKVYRGYFKGHEVAIKKEQIRLRDLAKYLAGEIAILRYVSDRRRELHQASATSPWCRIAAPGLPSYSLFWRTRYFLCREVSHPHLIKYYGASQHEKTVCIVTEYMNGWCPSFLVHPSPVRSKCFGQPALAGLLCQCTSAYRQPLANPCSCPCRW